MKTTFYKLTAAAAIGLSSLATPHQIQANEVKPPQAKKITVEKKENNQQKEDGELISNITNHVALGAGLTLMTIAFWKIGSFAYRTKWRFEDKILGEQSTSKPNIENKINGPKNL